MKTIQKLGSKGALRYTRNWSYLKKQRALFKKYTIFSDHHILTQFLLEFFNYDVWASKFLIRPNQNISLLRPWLRAVYKWRPVLRGSTIWWLHATLLFHIYTTWHFVLNLSSKLKSSLMILALYLKFIICKIIFLKRNYHI